MVVQVAAGLDRSIGHEASEPAMRRLEDMQATRETTGVRGEGDKVRHLNPAVSRRVDEVVRDAPKPDTLAYSAIPAV
ncbi:MAG: hypothetical protein ACRDLF_07515 [Solirubrobacteraceae bacterium]